MGEIHLYGIFEGLFNFINKIGNEGFTNIFLVIQVLIFFTMGLFQYIRISKEIKVMNSMKVTLSEINRKEGEEAKETELKIESAFQSINKSKYKELWERYYNRTSQKEADERIQVEPFFGFDVMHYHMGYRQLMDVGAGLFVSIGVLGTFIGLSAGLAELNMNDTDALRSGIGGLLGGMKVAFYTSVLGVSLSLVWTIFDRIISSRLDSNIDWHAERLDYLLSTDDEELFLNRLEKITRSQADHMKTLLTDVMEKAMQPVVASIQQSNGQITDVFGQLNEQFSSLHEGMNVQAKLLESQVELTKSSSKDVTEKLVQQITGGTEQTIANFGSLIHDTQNMQNQMMQTVQQVVTNFAESEKHQSNTFKKTEQMVGQFEQTMAEMIDMRESFKEISTFIVDVQGTFKSIQEFSQQQLPLQQDVMESNQALAQKYDDLSESFSKFNGQVEGKYQELLEQVVTVSTTLSSTFKDMTDRFTLALSTQERSLIESDRLLENVKAVVAELSPIAPGLVEVTGNLTDLKQQLKEMQASQTKLLPELIQMRSQTNSVVEETLEKTKIYMNNMTEQLETMKHSWNTTRTQFEETRQTLGTAVKEFVDNIDAGLGKTYSNFDETLTKAVSEVSNLVNQFKDVQEDFIDNVEDLSDKIEKAAAVMKR